MVSPGVEESWSRIRTWLGRNAPGTLAGIRPPASAATLAAARDAGGVPLAAGLAAWWLIADGMDVHGGHLLPPWFDPYPVAQALASRESWITVWQNNSMADTEFGRMYGAVLAWAGGRVPTADEQVARFMAEPAGTPCSGMYLPVWLPIAGSGMGTALFVDLRDG